MLPAYGVYSLGDIFEDEVQIELVLFFALWRRGWVDGKEGGKRGTGVKCVILGDARINTVKDA